MLSGLCIHPGFGGCHLFHPEKMPEVYGLPAVGPDSPPGTNVKEPGRTNFVVPVGKETVFPGSKAIGVKDIRDGCSDTIMAVAVDDDHAVIWTKPEDLPFGTAGPAEGLAALPKGGFLGGDVRWQRPMDSQGVRPEVPPCCLHACRG